MSSKAEEATQLRGKAGLGVASNSKYLFLMADLRKCHTLNQEAQVGHPFWATTNHWALLLPLGQVCPHWLPLVFGELATFLKKSADPSSFSHVP